MNVLEQTLHNFQQGSSSLELPTIKNEDWKYTNLARLWDKTFPPSNVSKPINIKDNMVEIFDLHFDTFELAGLTIRPANSEEVSRFKSHQGYFKQGFLSQLSEVSPLKFMVIEQTQKETSPAILKFHQSEGTQGHLAIICKNPKNIKTLFHFTGQGQLFVHNLTQQDENTHLEQVFLNQMDETFMLESHSELERDSKYSQVIKHEGNGLNRTNIAAKLKGENAECDMHGLMTPKGSGHMDTCGYIEHAAPHTYSRQVYKSILSDNAKGIFAGKVKVNKDCLLIEAEQLNKNLLLSEKAQAFSRPQMEIDADDVKCAHGSTTGQLSEQELFYFESRGIRKEKARQMLAQGFAMDVLLKIKNEELRNYLIGASEC